MSTLGLISAWPEESTRPLRAAPADRGFVPSIRAPEKSVVEVLGTGVQSEAWQFPAMLPRSSAITEAPGPFAVCDWAPSTKVTVVPDGPTETVEVIRSPGLIVMPLPTTEPLTWMCGE